MNIQYFFNKKINIQFSSFLLANIETNSEVHIHILIKRTKIEILKKISSIDHLTIILFVCCYSVTRIYSYILKYFIVPNCS